MNAQILVIWFVMSLPVVAVFVLMWRDSRKSARSQSTRRVPIADVKPYRHERRELCVEDTYEAGDCEFAVPAPRPYVTKQLHAHRRDVPERSDIKRGARSSDGAVSQAQPRSSRANSGSAVTSWQETSEGGRCNEMEASDQAGTTVGTTAPNGSLVRGIRRTGSVQDRTEVRLSDGMDDGETRDPN
jgi:hypothetical protein